jgi:hypothetical protein
VPKECHEHLDYNKMPRNVYISNLHAPSSSVTFVQVVEYAYRVHAGRTAVSRHLSVRIGKLLSGCEKFVKNDSYLLWSIAVLHY